MSNIAFGERPSAQRHTLGVGLHIAGRSPGRARVGTNMALHQQSAETYYTGSPEGLSPSAGDSGPALSIVEGVSPDFSLYYPLPAAGKGAGGMVESYVRLAAWVLRSWGLSAKPHQYWEGLLHLPLARPLVVSSQTKIQILVLPATNLVHGEPLDYWSGDRKAPVRL